MISENCKELLTLNAVISSSLLEKTKNTKISKTDITLFEKKNGLDNLLMFLMDKVEYNLD